MITPFTQQLLDPYQVARRILGYARGVQAHHGEAEFRVRVAEGMHGRNTFQVDVRQVEAAHTRVHRPCEHLFAIHVELLVIEVRVRVDEHRWRRYRDDQ